MRVVAAPPVPTIFASDLSPGAVGKTQSNLNGAHVGDFVTVERADLLTRAAPAPAGILLANPPYGVRLADQEKMAAFYPLLGDALKQRFTGWTACFFTGDLRLPKLIHLKVARKMPLFNGAIECRLFEFPIVVRAPRAGRLASRSADGRLGDRQSTPRLTAMPMLPVPRLRFRTHAVHPRPDRKEAGPSREAARGPCVVVGQDAGGVGRGAQMDEGRVAMTPYVYQTK